MLSTRTVILSPEEVCEAVRTFVRTKYHEKIEKGYSLTAFTKQEDGSVSFVFGESLAPFVKKE